VEKLCITGAMYSTESMGDRAEPCPNPTIASNKGERRPFYKNCVEQSLRYEEKNLTTSPGKPCHLRMSTRREWLSEGKNCAMSKATMLVFNPFVQPAHMRWVRNTPTSSVECCLIPFSWLEWKIPSHTVSYCMRCASIFLNSLPMMLSKTIGQNIFGMSWCGFPGLGMITDTDSLKQLGQWPREMQEFSIERRILAQSLSSIRTLRCHQVR
jgi:hypothetical protein